jgi:mannan endo-1,4-beta-mannosidase
MIKVVEEIVITEHNNLFLEQEILLLLDRLHSFILLSSTRCCGCTVDMAFLQRQLRSICTLFSCLWITFQFYVNCDSSVDFVIGNGVNLQPSYYNDGHVTFGWDLMHKYDDKIKTIRLEIEPDKVSEGRDWIKQAQDQGYSVIATYHKCAALGSDDTGELLAAANWWVANYAYLGGNFMINIMNEWGSHDLTSQAYSDSYNQAIATIRDNTSYSGALIIDISGWGQEVQTAVSASSAIVDNKVIFSAHIYPGSWNQAANRPMDSSDMDALYATHRPCLIGEFGVEPGIFGAVQTEKFNKNHMTHQDGLKEDGQCDVATVVSHAKEIGFLGVLSWAWNGDGDALNMCSPTWYENPTSDSYSESPYFWKQISLL